MSSASYRFVAGGVLALWAGVVMGGAEPPARPPPTRPTGASLGAVAIRKFGGLEYVNASDIAARLGLTLAWTERGRRLTIAGPGAGAVLASDTRDIRVNDLRVFLGHPIVDSRDQLFVSRIDYERCLTPLLRPGRGVALRSPPKFVVLDPGHGGRDNGTSKNEKIHALDVARRAKKLLEAAGFRVLLTREDDVFVEHAQRAAIANANRADAFVSIHFNALERDTRTSGVEVYTFPPQFQNSTNAWSPGQKPNAENEASPVNRFDHWNVVLAQALQRELVDGLKSPDRGKKLMHLKVLRPLRCPGALVECGFLTSDSEARKIETPAHRQKIAVAIAAGIRAYAATLESLRPNSRSVAASN